MSDLALSFHHHIRRLCLAYFIDARDNGRDPLDTVSEVLTALLINAATAATEVTSEEGFAEMAATTYRNVDEVYSDERPAQLN